MVPGQWSVPQVGGVRVGGLLLSAPLHGRATIWGP